MTTLTTTATATTPPPAPAIPYPSIPAFPHSRLILAIVLLAALVAVVTSLIHRDRSTVSPFKLDDLLLGDDGKASKAAMVMFGSFLVTSWIVIDLALRDKLTEGYFSMYLAGWVAPAVVKLIKGPTPT